MLCYSKRGGRSLKEGTEGLRVGRVLSLEAEGQGRRRGAESLMQKRRADTYAKEEGRGYMEEA